MSGGEAQRARVLDAVLQTQSPWSSEVEDRAVKAWIALDRFTSLSAAEIRQERRALLEMNDMLTRAMVAAGLKESRHV